MTDSKLTQILHARESKIPLQEILENSKAGSGGERDLDFLKFLAANKLLSLRQAVLKRTNMQVGEEYYLERYKKLSYESDRHFLCRTILQDELSRMGIGSHEGVDAGNMDVLRSNCNYDIITDDFATAIDIGLTPARNYFRGLTDLRIKNYLITTYFDDYIDDVILNVFTRTDDQRFLDAVRDFEEGFKLYSQSGKTAADDERYDSL